MSCSISGRTFKISASIIKPLSRPRSTISRIFSSVTTVLLARETRFAGLLRTVFFLGDRRTTLFFFIFAALDFFDSLLFIIGKFAGKRSKLPGQVPGFLLVAGPFGLVKLSGKHSKL